MKRVSADLVTATMIFAAFFSGLPAQPAGAVVTETLKLVPTDSAPGDDFGETVAVSGGVAVVGAPGSGPGGAAYVFDTTTGQQLFKLAPNDVLSGDYFGSGALAIADDLAYIGGARDSDGNSAIWIYDLTSGSQVGKWTVADAGAFTGFGASIAIHANTALVGAPSADDSGFVNAGTAYILDRTTGDLIAQVVPDIPVASARFGESVAINGGFAAVYGEGNDRIHLFDPVTGAPITDLPGPGMITNAGNSLALHDNRLLLGVANTHPGVNGVLLYDITDPLSVTHTPVPWPQPGPGFFFGSSVVLQQDAMLVSTWFSDEIDASGIVHLFDPDTGVLVESFRPSDAVEDDQFGRAMALDGQTLVVTAGLGNTGAAYLFTIPEPGALVSWLALGLLACPRRGRAPARGLRRGL